MFEELVKEISKELEVDIEFYSLSRKV